LSEPIDGMTETFVICMLMSERYHACLFFFANMSAIADLCRYFLDSKNALVSTTKYSLLFQCQLQGNSNHIHNSCLIKVLKPDQSQGLQK